MKIIEHEQNSEKWLDQRIGKITGSKVGDLISKKDGSLKKAGLYAFIAEQIATQEDDGENPMDRGHRLEQEAIEEYEKYTGKKTEKVGICVREDNEKIAISPDRLSDNRKLGVEVKCLSSAKHIQTIVENRIPSEYEEQMLQYFVVGDGIECVDFVFYDPRVSVKPLNIITHYREDYTEEIKSQLENERKIVTEIENIITKLTF